MAGTRFLAVLRRDLGIAIRSPVETLNPVVFFIIVTALFPLGVSPDPKLLGTIAAGVIWVCALLATLLALDALFRSDFEDGSLEQQVLSPGPLEWLVLARVLAHWLLTGVPLLLVSPLLAVWLSLPAHAIPALLASLALGTPTLSLLGSVGVALTVGLRRGGVLMPLLVLPLYIPVLVLGSQAVIASAGGLPAARAFFMLAALLTLAATLTPFATAAALRISID